MEARRLGDFKLSWVVDRVEKALQLPASRLPPPAFPLHGWMNWMNWMNWMAWMDFTEYGSRRWID